MRERNRPFPWPTGPGESVEILRQGTDWPSVGKLALSSLAVTTSSGIRGLGIRGDILAREDEVSGWGPSRRYVAQPVPSHRPGFMFAWSITAPGPMCRLGRRFIC